MLRNTFIHLPGVGAHRERVLWKQGILDWDRFLEAAEDGWIVAECPALPGCVSQGRDEEEALENIREAITAWLWAEDQKALLLLPPQDKPVVVAV